MFKIRRTEEHFCICVQGVARFFVYIENNVFKRMQYSDTIKQILKHNYTTATPTSPSPSPPFPKE
jgi:hypothetical protein